MIVQELIAVLGFQVNMGQVGQANGAIDSMSNRMALLGAAALAAGAAIGAVVTAVQGAAKLETLNAEFEVMLKNADAAKYIVQEINKFAAETPYETAGLTANVRLMMAFGQSALQSMKAVKMLGDVAGSDQERLNRLSLAYAQVFAAGKLQGQDMLQFVNAGFNPLTILAEKRKVSMAQMRKEMEQGKISAEMVQQAFEIATGKGGKFFGNMEKQSKTLNGLWSTLKDNFKMMSAELGTEFLPYLKAVFTALIELTPAIGDAFRQLSAFFGVFFKDGPTAVETANGIAASFMTLADTIMAVGSGLMFMWTIMQVVAMGVTQAVGAQIDAILLIPKVLGKVAYGLSYVISMIPGVDKAKYAADMAELQQFHGSGFGEYYNKATNDIGNKELVSGSWNKFLEMSSMIGGSNGAAPGAKVSLTEGILKALEAGGKTQTNNITNNVNVNAEGSLKDILKEQANAAFSITVLQTRLVGAAM